MDVVSLLKESRGTRFSLETYPPKTTRGKGEPSVQEHISKIFDTVEHLLPYKPLFVSVTYNPEGKTKATSIPIASIIRQRFNIEALAHLTSIGASREQIDKTLDVLEYFGIENVLALRGDPPRAGPEALPGMGCPPAGGPIMGPGIKFASELVDEIARSRRPFCIGVAAYPEGHPECVRADGERDLALDIRHFKAKVDMGASFAITQLFLDNDRYFSFVRRARDEGITIPIIPGIMPLVNYRNLKIVRGMCGVAVPHQLLQRLDEHRDDAAEVLEIGIEHAIMQCKGLMGRVPCIHFYAMNMWEPTERIIKALL